MSYNEPEDPWKLMVWSSVVGITIILFIAMLAS